MSSLSFARASLAIFWKACSKLMASFALVSKYGMFFDSHQFWARRFGTCRVNNFVNRMVYTLRSLRMV